jgi:hypothetical protein
MGIEALDLVIDAIQTPSLTTDSESRPFWIERGFLGLLIPREWLTSGQDSLYSFSKDIPKYTRGNIKLLLIVFVCEAIRRYSFQLW